MTFRDDSEALLARVEALEREKARLEKELAAERADDGDLEAERKALVDAEREASRKLAVSERENRALADRLRRERGPGPVKRLTDRVGAWKRTAATPADRATWASTYVAALRAVAPLYAIVLPLFVVPAIVWRSWHLWIVVAYAIGVPVLAVVTTWFPWFLGRRRLATAAGSVGLAIGLAAVGLLIGSLVGLWASRTFTKALLFLPPLGGIFGLVHFTRAVRLGDVPWYALMWIPIVWVPGPGLLFLGVLGPVWCWEVGGRFVDYTYGLARS
jgi:hypothetical protein